MSNTVGISAVVWSWTSLTSGETMGRRAPTGGPHRWHGSHVFGAIALTRPTPVGRKRLAPLNAACCNATNVSARPSVESAVLIATEHHTPPEMAPIVVEAHATTKIPGVRIALSPSHASYPLFAREAWIFQSQEYHNDAAPPGVRRRYSDGAHEAAARPLEERRLVRAETPP